MFPPPTRAHLGFQTTRFHQACQVRWFHLGHHSQGPGGQSSFLSTVWVPQGHSSGHWFGSANGHWLGPFWSANLHFSDQAIFPTASQSFFPPRVFHQAKWFHTLGGKKHIPPIFLPPRVLGPRGQEGSIHNFSSPGAFLHTSLSKAGFLFFPFAHIWGVCGSFILGNPVFPHILNRDCVPQGGSITKRHPTKVCHHKRRHLSFNPIKGGAPINSTRIVQGPPKARDGPVISSNM